MTARTMTPATVATRSPLRRLMSRLASCFRARWPLIVQAGQSRTWLSYRSSSSKFACSTARHAGGHRTAGGTTTTARFELQPVVTPFHILRTTPPSGARNGWGTAAGRCGRTLCGQRIASRSAGRISLHRQSLRARLRGQRAGVKRRMVDTCSSPAGSGPAEPGVA